MLTESNILRNPVFSGSKFPKNMMESLYIQILNLSCSHDWGLVLLYISFIAGESESSGKDERIESSKKASTSQKESNENDGNQRIGPAARLLLSQHGLSQRDLGGTGPYGIITKGDVLEALEKGLKPSKKQTSPKKDSSRKAESKEQVYALDILDLFPRRFHLCFNQFM